MKKAFLLILVVFIFSCKRDKFNWQCEINTTFERYNRDRPMTIERKGWTEKEIREYEKENCQIRYSDQYGLFVLECKCTKK